MHNGTERDERTYWSPADEPARGSDDDEPVPSDPVRPSRARRPDLDPRGVEASHRVRFADEEMFQRVGGRHRVRPEVVLAIAGAAFLIAALVKPWPNPAPVHTPSRIAAAPPTTAIAASQSPVGNADIPLIQFGIPGDLTQRWSIVDWSELRTIDPHSGWGFAAALMPRIGEGPAIIEGPAGPGTILPMTHWVAASSSPTTATLPVGSGQDVYAIAVTWPGNLQVSSVRFQWVSGSSYEPYAPPPGFPPYTQVSPLPADQVASPAVATQGAPPAASSQLAEETALRSGQFWIPPSEVSGNALSSSAIPTAWQSLPWPWPSGNYKVAVTSASGTTTILLHLEAGV